MARFEPARYRGGPGGTAVPSSVRGQPLDRSGSVRCRFVFDHGITCRSWFERQAKNLHLPGGEPARAFVWMQGHTYSNFANYQVQRTLLCGIAWAGKKPVDELVNYVAPPSPLRSGMRSGNSPR